MTVVPLFLPGWGKNVTPPITYLTGNDTISCKFALTRRDSSYIVSYNGTTELVETSQTPFGSIDNPPLIAGWNYVFNRTYTYPSSPSVSDSFEYTYNGYNPDLEFSGTEKALYEYLGLWQSFYASIVRNVGFALYIRQSILIPVYSSCSWFVPPSPFTSITPPKLYLGSAAPPPPPPKNMNCCDCNTIATIIEDKIISQLKPFGEGLKDHIDLRTKEEIGIHKQQLQAMEIDLQPLFKRLNEVERNLWNGILR